MVPSAGWESGTDVTPGSRRGNGSVTEWDSRRVVRSGPGRGTGEWLRHRPDRRLRRVCNLVPRLPSARPPVGARPVGQVIHQSLELLLQPRRPPAVHRFARLAGERVAVRARRVDTVVCHVLRPHLPRVALWVGPLVLPRSPASVRRPLDPVRGGERGKRGPEEGS